MNLVNIIVTCCLLASGVFCAEPLCLNDVVDDLLKNDLPKCENIDPMDTDDIKLTVMGMPLKMTKCKLYGIKKSTRSGNCTLNPKGDDYTMKMIVSNKAARLTGLMSGGPLKNAPCEITIAEIVAEVDMDYKIGGKPVITNSKTLKCDKLKMNIKSLPKALNGLVNKCLPLFKKKLDAAMAKTMKGVMTKLMAVMPMPI